MLFFYPKYMLLRCLAQFLSLNHIIKIILINSSIKLQKHFHIL
jgi:hypothetical protein